MVYKVCSNKFSIYEMDHYSSIKFLLYDLNIISKLLYDNSCIYTEEFPKERNSMLSQNKISHDSNRYNKEKKDSSYCGGVILNLFRLTVVRRFSPLVSHLVNLDRRHGKGHLNGYEPSARHRHPHPTSRASQEESHTMRLWSGNPTNI